TLTARTYGQSFPEHFETPGLFYFQSIPGNDSGPVRAATAASLQRYEDDLLTGSNLWMTYRAVSPGAALAGNYTLVDTVQDFNGQPLSRREELALTTGGGFRLREYYGGDLVVETEAASWIQPGPYVFAINPRQ